MSTPTSFQNYVVERLKDSQDSLESLLNDDGKAFVGYILDPSDD